MMHNTAETITPIGVPIEDIATAKGNNRNAIPPRINAIATIAVLKFFFLFKR